MQPRYQDMNARFLWLLRGFGIRRVDKSSEKCYAIVKLLTIERMVYMNTELAERLKAYREKAGLTVEQLADKLEIRPDTVAEWECGASSPDAEMLVKLSRIYEVPVDWLLKNQPTEAHEKRVDIGLNGIHVVDPDENNEVHVGFRGIHVKDGHGKQVDISKNGVFVNGEKKNFCSDPSWAIWPIACSVSVIVYLILGFCFNLWHPGWLIFLLVPFVSGIVDSIRHRNPSEFPYPIIVAFAYLTLGFLFDMWHPWWILFLTIPVYYSILSLFKHRR